MTTVASTFSIWSNRNSLPGGSSLATSYGAGQGQTNGAFQRSSNADARVPPVYGGGGVAYRGYTRLWSNLAGPYIDWVSIQVYELNAEPGSYSISGANTGDIRALFANAEPGSYSISGAAAALNKGYQVNAEPGSYLVSGAAATTIRALIVNAVAGVYAVTGVATTDVRALLVNAVAGVYTVTGADAALLRSLLANAEPGLYLITGPDAELIFDGGGGPPATPDRQEVLFIRSTGKMMN